MVTKQNVNAVYVHILKLTKIAIRNCLIGAGEMGVCINVLFSLSFWKSPKMLNKIKTCGEEVFFNQYHLLHSTIFHSEKYLSEIQ